VGVKEVHDLKEELTLLADRVTKNIEDSYFKKDSPIKPLFTRAQLTTIIEIAKMFTYQMILEYNAMDIDYNEPCPDDLSLLPLPPTEGSEL